MRVMQERQAAHYHPSRRGRALFIHRQALAVHELILERLQGDRIELELELEGAIRQAASLAAGQSLDPPPRQSPPRVLPASYSASVLMYDAIIA